MLRVIKVIDAPWFKIIDGTGAFSTASAKLLRNRRFRSNYLGHADRSVVTIIDVDLIKIIETRLYASSEDPRGSFGPDVSISLQPGQRTVPFPIGRGTERSFSDEPL